MQLSVGATANGRCLMWALFLLFVGLAAAVPASVLAQNTELSTNANNKLQQQQQQRQQQQQQLQQQQLRELPAVKRAEEGANSATVPPADKKSSPEIVPATYSNSPARSGPNEQQQQQQQQPQAGLYSLPSNDEILAAVAAAAQNSQQQLQSEPTALEEAVASSTMRKRGINYEYNPYMSVSNNDYGSDVPAGVWADDYEPSAPVNYNGYNSYNNERELQELEDYTPDRHANTPTGRNKAYDNLQNLLNAEAYLESIPLSVPLTYANRNYNLDERNKRGLYYNLASANAPSENINLNKYRRYGDMRLKRDTTKLTPADMLALVALVEAGERARKESDMESGISVPLVDAEELDYVPAAGSWLDAPIQQQQQQQAPALVDYYGMPVEAQVVPKYEYMPRPQKYLGSNGRLGSAKRFMVSKKKRSINQNQFLNEPVGERGPSYYGEKFY
ncbi:PREDICTED: probable serine/threonine-protein kinase tsuA isoform X2 [Drosophila arizonae]|uniref:Probable serine/threonine-protein kinase tsuA isoform X2 n=1 Tax=Drosophila arizonae TaxID=7263 RepID=A0ABM1NR15_DROAR|nr:PREDICTED: probable serine/threonine-protein kinase tsuA isoform X2 [Drosophila arizonae]